MSSTSIDPITQAFTFVPAEPRSETNWLAIGVIAVVLVTSIWWLSTKWVRGEARVATPKVQPLQVPEPPQSTGDSFSRAAAGENQTPPKTTRDLEGKWVQLGEWKGTEALDTPPFTVTSNKWRVTWTYHFQDPNISSLRMYIQRPNDPSHGYEITGANSNRGESGRQEFESTGPFELHAVPIKAEYQVAVEELRS